MYFAFYPVDFTSDILVESMTTLQVGAYWLLLCKAWMSKPPASLPDDDRVLARLARVEPQTWAKIKDGVMAPFHRGDDGRWYSKRLREEYEAAKNAMAARIKGGKSRGGSRGTNGAFVSSAGSSAGAQLDAESQLSTSNPGGDLESSFGRQKQSQEKTPLPPAKPGGERGTSGESEIIRPAPFADLIAEWNRAGLPGHDKVQETSLRRGWFENRQADARWRAEWREAVARMGRSAKCMGRVPNFMTGGVRIDTFLREHDFLVRVMEGEFDDAPTAAPVQAKPMSAGRARVEEILGSIGSAASTNVRTP